MSHSRYFSCLKINLYSSACKYDFVIAGYQSVLKKIVSVIFSSHLPYQFSFPCYFLFHICHPTSMYCILFFNRPFGIYELLLRLPSLPLKLEYDGIVRYSTKDRVGWLDCHITDITVFWSSWRETFQYAFLSSSLIKIFQRTLLRQSILYSYKLY